MGTSHTLGTDLYSLVLPLHMCSSLLCTQIITSWREVGALSFMSEASKNLAGSLAQELSRHSILAKSVANLFLSANSGDLREELEGY